MTGVAGFIGSHVAHRLLERGRPVLGIDWLGEGKDARLQADRLARLTGREGFEFARVDLCDADAVQALFAREPGCTVLHPLWVGEVEATDKDVTALLHEVGLRLSVLYIAEDMEGAAGLQAVGCRLLPSRYVWKGFVGCASLASPARESG